MAVKRNTRPTTLRPSLQAVAQYHFRPVENENNMTYCLACSRVLENTAVVLDSHFDGCTRLTYMPNASTVFACGPCSLNTDSFEHWKHLHVWSNAHWDRCAIENETLVSYSCDTCETVMYDTDGNVRAHLSNEQCHKPDLPHVVELMAHVLEVFKERSKCKPLYFCDPCKQFSYAPVHPDYRCQNADEAVEPFYCRFCRVMFVCHADTYVLHLSSLEHLALSTETNLVCDDAWKLPQIVRSRFVRLNANACVYCASCHLVVASDSASVVEHLKKCVGIAVAGSAVAEKSDCATSRPTRRFCCGVCDAVAVDTNGWERHVLTASHLTSCSDRTQHHGYFECRSCRSLLFGTPKQAQAAESLAHDVGTDERHTFALLRPSELMDMVYKAFNADPLSPAVFFYYEATGNFGRCERNVEPAAVPHYCRTCRIEFYGGRETYEQHELTCEHILIKYFVPVKSVDSHLFPGFQVTDASQTTITNAITVTIGSFCSTFKRFVSFLNQSVKDKPFAFFLTFLACYILYSYFFIDRDSKNK
ncbi:uncharacterized protein LOC126838885 [Adelges cooleyi]|uniref:uncharacterized protein LOC126838885 n=1 Tax=Adelges cooleyi TaxID=133065 RepID=UPI0021806824|nr:uncharacterized protein LOC126838885 [Adelges cooleyi]